MCFKLIMPQGWTAEYDKTLLLTVVPRNGNWKAEITAGENVDALNRVIIEISSPSRPTVCLIPVTILG